MCSQITEEKAQEQRDPLVFLPSASYTVFTFELVLALLMTMFGCAADDLHSSTCLPHFVHNTASKAIFSPQNLQNFSSITIFLHKIYKNDFNCKLLKRTSDIIIYTSNNLPPPVPITKEFHLQEQDEGLLCTTQGH